MPRSRDEASRTDTARPMCQGRLLATVPFQPAISWQLFHPRPHRPALCGSVRKNVEPLPSSDSKPLVESDYATVAFQKFDSNQAASSFFAPHHACVVNEYPPQLLSGDREEMPGSFQSIGEAGSSFERHKYACSGLPPSAK
jgi:hypothetical protein